MNFRTARKVLSETARTIGKRSNGDYTVKIRHNRKQITDAIARVSKLHTGITREVFRNTLNKTLR